MYISLQCEKKSLVLIFTIFQILSCVYSIYRESYILVILNTKITSKLWEVWISLKYQALCSMDRCEISSVPCTRETLTSYQQIWSILSMFCGHYCRCEDKMPTALNWPINLHKLVQIFYYAISSYFIGSLYWNFLITSLYIYNKFWSFDVTDWYHDITL